MARRQKDAAQDREFGKKLRTLRLLRDMSQTELGDLLGFTFQQVQKYENGSNSMSVGTLQKVCQIFNVKWSHFLPQNAGDEYNEKVSNITKFLSTQDGVRLTQAAMAIQNREILRRFLCLMEEVAGQAN